MKKILIALLFLAGFAFVLSRFLLHKNSSKLTHKVILGNSSVVVEIADTPQKTQQGLSNRETLCSNCGMLFVFDKKEVHSFWMRRMHFNIDMIWVADDRVVDISYNAKVPPPEESEAPRTTYQSKVPCNMVLEVNAGWAEENKIEIGASIKLVK